MPVETSTPKTQPARLNDQAVSDTYIYLLGRLTVTRQQQLDFKEGFKWNELVHRKPGAVDWPNQPQPRRGLLRGLGGSGRD